MAPQKPAARGTKAALMASTAATPVVTGAGVRETVTLGVEVRPGQNEPPDTSKARTYILAAPYVSEMGAFLEGRAREGAPGAADLAEAYRAALEASGAGTEALDDYEMAEDAWVSFVNVHVITGPDATENIQAQAVALNLAMLRARRVRERAIAKVQRAPEILDIKARQLTAQWNEHCGMLALLLRGWGGPGLEAFPGTLDAEAVARLVPMADIGALAPRAYQLMQPAADAGKA